MLSNNNLIALGVGSNWYESTQLFIMFPTRPVFSTPIHHLGGHGKFYWSFFFLTFVHCVLGGCLLDQTLLPHSGSLSWLLLGWIIRCPLHPPWLLINSFSIKNQNPWRGVSYHLPFAFTFAPLQKKLHVPWPKVLAWTRLLFFIKITLSAAIIDMKPKENSSV